MKKLFLTLAIVFAGIMSVNAQGLWIGGSANAKVQTNDVDFAIAPEIGYNFNNHWAIASAFKFRHVNDETTAFPMEFNQFIVSPYVRYIGGTIGHKFSLFCDLTYDIDILSPQMWATGLQPGIAWQATDKFTAAFRFGFLGYDHFFQRGNGFFFDCTLGTSWIGIYYNF